MLTTVTTSSGSELGLETAGGVLIIAAVDGRIIAIEDGAEDDAVSGAEGVNAADGVAVYDRIAEEDVCGDCTKALELDESDEGLDLIT